MPELASISESLRQSALQRFQLLRAHLEDGRSLATIAREANVSYRTLQYWLERYRTSGLAALARKPRIDRGRRRKRSAALQEAIEGLALKKHLSRSGLFVIRLRYWRTAWEKKRPPMIS
jgi:putative transposase